MLRKIALLVILVAAPLTGIAAQQVAPPPGFFIALADLSVRVGQSFSLTCSGPSTDANCVMNDPGLDWGWRQEVFPDASLGCPQASEAAAQVQTRGWVYEFTYEGISYDYRHSLPDASDLFLCTSTGREDPVGPGNPPPPVTTPSCPITPRLTVGEEARVTDENNIPNNVRSGPGLSNELIGEIPAGESFTVVSGPTCTADFTWWEVNYNGLVGWTVEGGTDGDYFLEPLTLPTTVLAPIDTSSANLASPLWSLSLPSTPLDIAYATSSNLSAIVSPQSIAFYEPFVSTQPIYTIATAGESYNLATFNTAGTSFVATEFNSQQSRSRILIWPTRYTSGGTNQAIQATEIVYLQDVAGTITALEFSPNDTVLAAGFSTANGSGVRVYNVANNYLSNDITTTRPVSAIAFSSVNNTMIVALDNGQVDIYNLADLSFQRTLINSGEITGGRFFFSTNNDGLLAYLDNTRNLQIWDAVNFILQRNIPISPANFQPNGLAFSPDGTLLVVTGNAEEDLTYMINPVDGMLVRSLVGTSGPVLFSPNNSLNLTNDQGWVVWGIRN